MRHKGIKLENKCRNRYCNNIIKGKQMMKYCNKCRWKGRRIVNEVMLINQDRRLKNDK